MNSTEITTYAARLDDLRVVTLTDGEVWSARDLMELAGYTDWRNWSKAIDRAIASVNTSGLNAADHFVGSNKMVDLGSGGRRQVEDVEITRYGAYILFQNADASKPEIAAAQQYFAVQTRKQEVSAAAMSEDEIVARALQITSRRVEVLEAKVAEDAPKVEYVDQFVSKEDVLKFGTAANELGIPVGILRQRLIDAHWIYKQHLGQRWSQTKGEWEPEYEYRAYSAHADKFKPMPQHNAPRYGDGKLKYTLYIRAAALPAIRRRLNTNLVAVSS